MKVLVLGAGRYTHQLLAALRLVSLEHQRPLEILHVEPEGLTGTKVERVIIDSAYELDQLMYPQFDDEPNTCDRRRRSKGDKHRNRKHRWSAG